MIGIIALAFSALFAGAAFYINFSEHPARMILPPDQAVRQWAPAYARGYMMQASLAILGGVSGLVAWAQSDEILWLADAAAMLANWPWTVLIIMPVNRKLFALASTSTVDDTAVGLLNRWNRLHAVRTALGTSALVLFALALHARIGAH